MSPEEEEVLIKEYNAKFPYKVELHLHLDGAVRLETILDIARERNMKDLLPHKTVEELTKDVILTEPSSLDRLLQSFAYISPILKGYKPATSRIAYELCEDCARHNIKYAEVRYSPHLLAKSLRTEPETYHEYTPDHVVQTVNEAMERGMKDFGITMKTILCCITHREDWVDEVLELCKKYRGSGVVGIDIAGMEFKPGKDPSQCKFKKAFAEAAKCGIHRTVHAGEIGTAQAVKEALDHMKAERIGHGYHAYDDPEVYQRVIKEQVHLEICPISSVLTRACPADIQVHPLKAFVKDGVNFSLNTDDPVVLGNTLTDDFKVATDMGLSNDDIIKGIFNAARSCFASDEEKKQILDELTKAYGPH